MFPPKFDYVAPRTLDEAADFLDKHRDEAKILAGGHSLIPLLRFRFASPSYLVDINRIPDLEYIRESNEYLQIGPLTRYVDVENSEIIKSKYPILSDAAGHIGDALVRNMGTVGGNICHSDPANDLPAVMLTLGASMVAISHGNERTIHAEQFFVDTFQTDLKQNELLKEILVPVPSSRTGSAYERIDRGAGDFPVAGAAALVQLDEHDVCQRAGVSLTAAGPRAVKSNHAELALRGRKLGERELQNAADLAAEDSRPISDIRGPAEYKREMVRVLVVRALKRAIQRTGT